jgi:hypothetical protein
MYLPGISVAVLLAVTAPGPSYQELTPEEMGVLDKASATSEAPLSAMVAGSDCQTVCRDVKDSYGEWKRVCDTSCGDSPSYDSGPRTSKHPNLAACLLGATGGVVLGSMAGWTGAAIGAGVGCAIFGGLNYLFSE